MVRPHFALLLILGVALFFESPCLAQDFDNDGFRPRLDKRTDSALGPSASTPPSRGAATGGRGSLTTIFASNNGAAGNTFDITPSIDLSISGIDVNVSPGGKPFQLDLYWKEGTAVGYESDAAAWTLLWTGSGTSAGNDLPSYVDLGGNGTFFRAGQTYGIYVDMCDFSGSPYISYTNGGPATYSNADLSLTTNTGQGSPPFTNYFQYRIWNGTIYYSPVIKVPEEEGTIQDAIDGAVNGDAISVAPGTYYENIDFKGKAIRLFSRTPGGAVIDGAGLGSVVTFDTGEDDSSVLGGFIITNGANSSGGGGIRCDSTSPTIVNNRVENNSSAGSGGGLFCSQGSPLVEGNFFKDNSAATGGGGYFHFDSARVRKNVFEDNHASDYGGGFYCYYGTTLIDHNIICGNETAGPYGGGVRLYRASPASFSNNLICRNLSNGFGGGIATNAETTITNCTICDNRSANLGGGLYVDIYAVTVTDSIIWANSADLGGDQVWDPTGIASVSYSDVQGGWPGTGNIDSDPLFTRGTSSACGDYYLGQTAAGQYQTSPCVDAGSDNAAGLGLDSYYTRTDHQGDSGTVDMGFHDVEPVIKVPADFPTIQAAIDAASTGKTVAVSPGTYNEDIDFKGKAIKVVSSNGPETTTIKGTGSGSVVTISTGEGRSSILEGFTITNGNSMFNGGGIVCYNTSPTIVNNRIVLNMADDWGGGMLCSNGSPLVEGNHFEANSAFCGGGAYFMTGSATIVRNRFEHNESISTGGGLYYWSGAPVIEDNIIRFNKAAGNGGGVYLNQCTATSFTNNLICENETEAQGGGINAAYSNSTIRNCTICNNTAQNGGGVYSGFYTLNLVDSILWGNRATSGGSQIAEMVGVGYSDILGGYAGTGNIESDPIFTRGPCTEAGDFYLSQTESGQATTSPCVDAGSDTAANLGIDSLFTRTDHVEDAGTVDMGFHHYRNTIAVPGESATIQAGIDAARDGDVVLVAPGTYHEDIRFYGKAITVASTNGADMTTIVGSGQTSVVKFTDSEGPRSVLDGFTITNGRDWGGGIRCLQASPTIVNNRIENNDSGTEGGGIYCSFSSAKIVGNRIMNNTAYDPGGGIYCSESHPTIERNLITGNSVDSQGGGGVGLSESLPFSFDNNIICGNSAHGDGGGVSTTQDLTLSNCTICDNATSATGGGIWAYNDVILTVTNSILWGNTGLGGGDQIYCDGTVVVTFSDVQDGWTGTGNIDAPPLFSDPASDDYHLLSISPCIDSGHNGAPGIPLVDFDGDQRIFGRGIPTVDMGADEFTDITLIELDEFKASGRSGTIHVTWKTSYEIDIGGFHVWRSDKPEPDEEDFTRITTIPLPALGDPSQGQEYDLEDTSVIVGHPYSYRLESFSYGGESLFFESATARWEKSYLEHR